MTVQISSNLGQAGATVEIRNGPSGIVNGTSFAVADEIVLR